MAGDRQLTAWGSQRVGTAIPMANRRWLVVNALAATAAINVVVNFVVAWLGTRGAHSIALWATPLKRPSTIADTVGTTFTLPFITTVLCTRAARQSHRADDLAAHHDRQAAIDRYRTLDPQHAYAFTARRRSPCFSNSSPLS